MDVTHSYKINFLKVTSLALSSATINVGPNATSASDATATQYTRDRHLTTVMTASWMFRLNSVNPTLCTYWSCDVGRLVIAVLPVLIACAGDGNIHLLEAEVAEALRSCLIPGDDTNTSKETTRQRRSEEYGYDEQYADRTPRIDNNGKQDVNQYGHERRNTTGVREQIHVLNATDFDYGGYGSGNEGENLVNSVPRPANGGEYGNTMGNSNRTRRSEPLLNKPDSDQCLSQCVFANLQVVDSRGIPRESELWNKIQSSVTSQQSRAALHDQTRACFQELQSEAEDNGCSYSNKLEHCLMLRLSDRKTSLAGTTQTNRQN